ncbi:MAG: branched-chain amino acid ABC transporter permease [Anaerolineae bacterium]
MKSILTVTLVLLALFLGLGFILPDWTIFLLTIALAKGLAVLGVALLMQAGLVSFGQGLFYAASAYALGFAMRLLNVQEALLVTILGVIMGMAVAALVGLLIARYREIFFAMLSLAFTMALWGALQKSTDITGGDDGMGIATPTILGIGFPQEQLRLALYFYTLVCAAIVIYLVYRYLDSPLGYAARAVKDNEVRVEYLGMSVQRTIYMTYILAAGLAGLGGALVALNVGHITPELAYWATSGSFISIALLGGTGSVFAPLIGSVAFEFIRSEAASRWPDAWQLIIGVIMLAVILFMPRGLWTIVETVGRKVRR